MTESHTVSDIRDEHRVTVCFGATPGPIPFPYGRTSIVVDVATFRFRRARADAPFELDEVRIKGTRARKDGSASQLDATADLSPRRGEVPEWLSAIAARHAPHQPRLARIAPGEDDAIDLDEVTTP